MEDLDPFAGQGERGLGGGRGRRKRCVDLVPPDTQAALREVETVEPARGVDKRRVAALAHILDERCRGRIDILGDLPLGRKQGPKRLFKTRLGGVQSQRHATVCSGVPRIPRGKIGTAVTACMRRLEGILDPKLATGVAGPLSPRPPWRRDGDAGSRRPASRR